MGKARMFENRQVQHSKSGQGDWHPGSYGRMRRFWIETTLTANRGKSVSRIVFTFQSRDSANTLVAGVPLVARICRDFSMQDGADNHACFLAWPGAGLDGGSLDADSVAEIDRLAPDLALSFVDLDTLADSPDDQLFVAEYVLPFSPTGSSRAGRLAQHRGHAADLAEVRAAYDDMGETGLRRQLKDVGRTIVRQTGKSGDGIVSRYINRPISTRISRSLLPFRWIRPTHATILTTLAGLAMAVCLFTGTYWGLMSGAVLFQIASILDGVDGELARATFHSSARGAMLDSVTDAITNLTFLLGLAFNLWQSGFEPALALGVFAFACLGVGLGLLGLFAVWMGSPVNFDSVKNFLRKRRSAWVQILIWITMRDFFAAASMILVLTGLAHVLLIIFAGVTVVWLMVVLIVLRTMISASQKSARKGHE